MVLGLGCDTMATMTTRILGTPKERLIAILLLALGIPCSAQLATIMGILGGISFAALRRCSPSCWPDVLRRLAGGAGADGRAIGVHHGAAADPAGRACGNLLTKTRAARAGGTSARRCRCFSSARRCCSCSTGSARSTAIATAGRPIVTGAARAAADDRADLRDGVPAPRLRRRRHCSSWRTAAQLTGVQAVVALTVMTLFVPCVANFLMMVRERGLKIGCRHPGVRHRRCRRHGRRPERAAGDPPCHVLSVRPLSALPAGSRGGIVRVTRDLTSARGAAGGARGERRRARARPADVSGHRLPVRSDGAGHRTPGGAQHLGRARIARCR